MPFNVAQKCPLSACTTPSGSSRLQMSLFSTQTSHLRRENHTTVNAASARFGQLLAVIEASLLFCPFPVAGAGTTIMSQWRTLSFGHDSSGLRHLRRFADEKLRRQRCPKRRGTSIAHARS